MKRFIIYLGTSFVLSLNILYASSLAPLDKEEPLEHQKVEITKTPSQTNNNLAHQQALWMQQRRSKLNKRLYQAIEDLPVVSLDELSN